MKIVLFFCRVAFICNICFALAWLFRYYPALQQGEITSTILILGIVVSGILNILVSGCLIVLLLLRKPPPGYFPWWLIIVNFLFLIPQLILYFK